MAGTSFWSSSQFAHKQGLGRIALCATFLGLVLGAHAVILLLHWDSYNSRLWCAYAIVLAVFHLLEFFTTAYGQPGTVSSDSFLLNHSWAYGIAVLASWLECAAWLWLAPGWKAGWPAVSVLGLALCTAGQLLRSLAMYQAGVSFTHLIADSKRPEHVLVTSGVYAVSRHPAYLGWFWWSIGTQLLLANPICTVLYSVVTWKFFADRIPYEERTLLAFFGPAYRAYASRTGVWIPFVSSPATAMSLKEVEDLHREYQQYEGMGSTAHES